MNPPLLDLNRILIDIVSPNFGLQISKQYARQKWLNYLNTTHATVFQSVMPSDMKLYRINMDRSV